jgi:hypothetical protein
VRGSPTKLRPAASIGTIARGTWRLAPILAFLCAAGVRGISAQSARAHKPAAIAIAKQALQHLEGGRWVEFVGLVDSVSLARFRDEQIEHAKAWEPGVATERHVAPEGAPFCVQEYFEALRARDSVNPVLSGIDGVSSVRDLMALPARELAIRWFSSGHGRNWASPSLRRRAILGAVPQGDSVAHVLYQRLDEGEEPIVHVMTARRGLAGWRIVLNEDLLGDDYTGGIGQRL